jgi:hypothetical protein
VDCAPGDALTAAAKNKVRCIAAMVGRRAFIVI